MSFDSLSLLEANRLKFGDILMTRSGANYGQTSAWKENDEAFACADILVFRKPKCPSGYLSTFFCTTHGKLIIERGAYGMAQPHIAPTYLEQVAVPRFETLEIAVDDLVNRSVKLKLEQNRFLVAAEQTLLRALDLENWQPPEPLTYTRRASEVLEHGRFDAEHYQEQYYALAAKLREHPGGVATLGELCPNPMNGVEIREYAEEGVPYLRVGDIKNYTVNPAGVKFVAHEAAAKEIDKVRLQTGDVLVSRSGSLAVTGVVEPEWKHSVISSHLILVRLQDPAFKPHYVAAFLAAMPGKMQIIQHSNGGVQPEINQPSLKRVLIPRLADSIQTEIITQIRQAHTARQQAQTLLATAKRAVEVAIEEGEAAAMQILHSA